MKIGFYKENFIDEANAAASVEATRGIKVGGTIGHVYAVAVAGADGFSIAAGKKVTLTATESDTLDGEYAASGVSTVRTFADAETLGEGEIIAELAFPSYCKDYAKVTFACDDAAVDGQVKVIPYPRG